MALLERVHRALEWVSRGATYLAGAGLLAVAALVVFEVLARRFLDFTITGIDEVSGFTYAVAMAWGFAFTQFQRANIRVDVVYVRFPLVVRCVLDVVSLVVLLGLMAFLSLRALALLQKSLALKQVSMSPLQIPMWIPLGLWVAGLAFFVVCLLVLSLRSVLALTKGRLDVVESIAHTPAITEHVEESVSPVANGRD